MLGKTTTSAACASLDCGCPRLQGCAGARKAAALSFTPFEADRQLDDTEKHAPACS